MEASRQEVPPQAGRMEYCSSAYEAAREAHALLILTEWQEYRELDLVRLHELIEVPVIVDGRNLLDPEAVRSADFEYVDMGRNPLKPDVVRSIRFESVGTGEKLRVEQPVTTVEGAS
jgi:UDPglucose 6-dehydrogenase